MQEFDESDARWEHDSCEDGGFVCKTRTTREAGGIFKRLVEMGVARGRIDCGSV